MLVLVIGLVIFFAIHLVPSNAAMRDGLIARFGLTGYKAIFGIVSLIGFALIVVGFAKLQMHPGKNPQLWVPPQWTRHLAVGLMWPAIIALVAAYVPSRIHTMLKHPMLVAIKIWALAHLLANGDAGGMLLFGSFLAWAVFDRIAVKKRGDMGARRITSFTRADAIALGAGTLAYIAVMVLHPVLFGVAVIGR